MPVSRRLIYGLRMSSRRTRTIRRLLCSLAVVACGESEAPEPALTLEERMTNDPELSTFLRLTRAAPLGFDLGDPSVALTIFAPTNAAFEALDPVTVEDLEAFPEILRDVLRYHVVEVPLSARRIADISPRDVLTSAGVEVGLRPGSDDDTPFRLEGRLRRSRERSRGRPTCRIELHPCRGPRPPSSRRDSELPAATVWAAADREGLGRLLELVEAVSADLVTLLGSDGPWTLLGPTDDALRRRRARQGGSRASGGQDYVDNILRAHGSSPPDVSLEELASAGSVISLANVSLGAEANGPSGPRAIGGAAVAKQDLLARNGRLHVLSEMVFVPSIAERLATTSSASAFGARFQEPRAREASDTLRGDVFEGDEPITLFLPLDGTFSPSDLSGAADVQVGLHMLAGQWTSNDLRALAAGSTLASLAGLPLTSERMAPRSRSRAQTVEPSTSSRRIFEDATA
ncbi:MAG: fasciclin domain-containing protein [Myxococcales bacterium]|nr:fasciclin domain-containing protein [Myxococcales bacterium]